LPVAVETDLSGSRPPTYDELVRLVGDLEPAQIAAIERLGATIDEIEEALAYAVGEDDVMGEARLPLIGRVADVYEILIADQEFEDER